MAMRDMHKLIDQTIAVLFQSDKKRLIEWTDRIIKANQEARNIKDNAIVYAGQFFRMSTVTGPIPRRATLDVSLVPQMEQLLKDRKIVEDQKAFVRQAIVQLLDPCQTLQDIRDALPDCLTNCIPNLRQFERTRPAAFTIAENPRAMRQYQKMLPNIQVYSSTRLI